MMALMLTAESSTDLLESLFEHDKWIHGSMSFAKFFRSEL